MKINPLLLIDYYKATHAEQYPKNITRLVSYYTPRKSRLEDDKQMVHFGLQYFIQKYLIEGFEENFFDRDIDEVCNEYDYYLKHTLQDQNDLVSKVRDLHILGYLPLEIKALPEGTIVPMQVPCIEITNTHPDFAWLVNTIESLMCAELWHAQLSASVGLWYRNIVDKWYDKTCDDNVSRSLALGDFSFRGQESAESAITSSAGFLLSFLNSATVPTGMFMEKYYLTDLTKEPVVYGSVSFEHSTVCSNFAVDGDEITLLRKSLTETYSDTTFSYVSDSYDYWNLVENILPELREEIMTHNGTLLIRGDCYDDQTRILTNNGWKYFKNLEKSDLVAQYDNNNHIEFVKPLQYIEKEYNGNLINFSSQKSNINFNVTPNHRMVYIKNNIIEIEQAENIKYYGGKNLPVAGLKTGTINKLTPYEQLMIAFQADGRCRGIDKTEQFEKGYTLEFSFSKIRKMERLEGILNNLRLEYKKVQTPSNLISKHNKNWKDEFIYYVNIKNKPNKHFDEWVKLEDKSYLWCSEFIEEISYWDGHVRKDINNYIEFDNTNENDVKIVQTIAVLAGYKTKFTKKVDNRKDIFQDVYRCLINKKTNFIGGQSIKKEKMQYNGIIYCVTVPSGMLVVERDNQVFISGNSGNPIDIICGTFDPSEYEDCEIGYTIEKGMNVLLNSKYSNSELEEFYKNKQILSTKFHFNYDYFNVKTKIIPVTLNEGKEHIGYLYEHEFEPVDTMSPEARGTVQCLWDKFRGSENEKGYKVLNPKIKAIYGDGITVQRAEEIYRRLEAKGFASSNVALGVGSFSMQCVQENGKLIPHTRDTFSIAVKSTECEVEDKSIPIFKNPITDKENFKKSQKGCCVVHKHMNTNGEEEIKSQDGLTYEQVCDDKSNLLKTVFKDGKMIREQSLSEIRKKLHGGKF